MEEEKYHYYSGPLTVIDPLHDDESEISRNMEIAADKLGRAKLAGLDFEWTPDFDIPLSEICEENPGNPVALIQIALPDWVLVYRHFEEFPLPEILGGFLLRPDVKKFVLCFDLCDKLKLKSTFNLEIPPESISEVTDKTAGGGGGLKSWAFRRGGWVMRKSKKIGTSEWGCRSSRLSEAQIHYAAEDAFFTLLLGLSFGASDAGISGASEIALGLVKRSGKRRITDEEWTAVRNEEEHRTFALNDDIYELKDNKVKRRRLGTTGKTETGRSDGNLSIEAVVKVLIEHPVGQYMTDRVIVASILDKDALDVTKEERDELQKIVTNNKEGIDCSYDGDRKLGLYRLMKHPKRSTTERITEMVGKILAAADASAEAEFVDEIVAENPISDFVGSNTEEEHRLIFSLVSKVKLVCDSKSGKVDVSSKSYKKQVLNNWVREVKQKMSAILDM